MASNTTTERNSKERVGETFLLKSKNVVILLESHSVSHEASKDNHWIEEQSVVQTPFSEFSYKIQNILSEVSKIKISIGIELLRLLNKYLLKHYRTVLKQRPGNILKLILSKV